MWKKIDSYGESKIYENLIHMVKSIHVKLSPYKQKYMWNNILYPNIVSFDGKKHTKKYFLADSYRFTRNLWFSQDLTPYI